MSNDKFDVTMKDGAALTKKIQKLEDGGKTAVKRTVSDFTSRAPGWVRKGIREEYGVDTAGINKAGPKIKRGGASIQTSGIEVDNVALEYSGEPLTPTHFNMSPKSTDPKGRKKKGQLVPGQNINFNGTPGQVAAVSTPNAYKVKATIIKGQRTNFSTGTFIAPAGNKDGGAAIPFQRTGSGRGPTHAVHTLSVPQMISGRAKDTIEELIAENLEKRFEHHVEQAMK